MRASLLLAAMLLTLPCIAPSAAAAAENARAIVVSGEGMISAEPDQARLTAGVVNQAATAAAALAANSTAMNKVFAALRAAGIPDTKIRTSNFSVEPQYPPFRADNPQPRSSIGYQVSNQVTVMVDDLAKVGATMDALVKSGANDVGGVSFSIADTKPLEEKARTLAVADAMAKARALATAAGVALGPLQSIDEGTAVRPIGPVVFARAVAAPAATPPPIAAGEESVSVNVTMTYAIQ